MRSAAKSSVIGVAVAMGLAATLVGAGRQQVGTRSGESPTTLAVTGRQNANASMAALGEFVVLAWGAATEGGTTDVFASASRDGGRTFDAPVRVNNVAGDARLSGEQPAHVSLLAREARLPSIVVVWTAKGEKGTRLLTARSDDGGALFSPAAVVPGSDQAGNRGWESTTVDRRGRVVVMWLDHRELASGDAMAGMQHTMTSESAAANADALAKAQRSKLMVSRLDRSPSPLTITGGVCYCCKTALAAGPDGALFAAWRHVYPGNIRDIAFTASRDDGQTFATPGRVSSDNWELNGCPEDGPALAVDPGNRVHIVWPTLVPGSAPGREPELALFYAVSSDGRRFTARQRLPTLDTPHHAQIITTPDGNLVAAWDEGAAGRRRIVWARGVVAGSSVRFTRAGQVDSERAVYPLLAATSSRIVIAWTGGPAEASHIGVRAR